MILMRVYATKQFFICIIVNAANVNNVTTLYNVA